MGESAHTSILISRNGVWLLRIQKVYWLTISHRGETGGERPHKMKGLLPAF